jgi:hypothetical protein
MDRTTMGAAPDGGLWDFETATPSELPVSVVTED